jgi:hypothetical protein
MRLDKYAKRAIASSIVADIPKPDYAKRKAAIQDAIVKEMSPEVRRIYKTKPHALADADTNLDLGGWNYQSRLVVIGDVDSETFAQITKPYRDEDESRKSITIRIESIVNACSTLSQLHKALPEFAKYFPSETQPTKNLPAVANLVADLTKLGWPAKKAA